MERPHIQQVERMAISNNSHTRQSSLLSGEARRRHLASKLVEVLDLCMAVTHQNYSETARPRSTVDLTVGRHARSTDVIDGIFLQALRSGVPP